MSAIPKIEQQTYLEQERLAQTKSEFIDGEVFAMTGASSSHNLIAMNIGGGLWGTRGRQGTSTYFYPHIS